MKPHVFQINISDGGVPKQSVPQANISAQGVAGDRQRNLKVHGGPERAVCLFALESILALQEEGHPIYPGAAGENLTLAGLDWAALRPGDQLQIGSQVVLELTRYTEPCGNLAPFFTRGDFHRIAPDTHPDQTRFYARVLQSGEVTAGDLVLVR
jgi:MOSC domain-containing protein YiiM